MLHYDMVVVGGGIHGAGVAQAAAAQGYTVLVLEEKEIGWGTSSRSSKLIHGGLRYLETAQLPLVYESLHERELLLKNARELVQRTPFFIPVYRHSKRGPLKIRLGLSLYALLGGCEDNVQFRRVPRSEWDSLDGLEPKRLSAVFQYWDAQTDDQALTQAVMHSAQALGARLAMPATLESAEKQGDHYQIDYFQQGENRQCRATVLVNAAGPWVNQVLDRCSPSVQKIETECVQGSHIIIKGTIQEGIYYLEAPVDQRPVFVMPWKNQIMVGTTETLFQGDPAQVKPLDSEKNYLLDVLSTYFPRFQSIQLKDIDSAFAGLRILPKGKGRFGGRPRETRFVVDDAKQPRLLSLYGGKLTTYRKTAQKVIDKLSNSLPDRKQIADTAEIKLKAVFDKTAYVQPKSGDLEKQSN